MTEEEILRAVSEATNVPTVALKRKGRTRMLSRAKFLATREIRKAFPWWTLQQTADFFGEKNHWTVVHRLRQAEWLIATDASFRSLSERVWNR